MSPLPPGLRQPDARSCGAASLVAARMLLDPGYAERVAGGQQFALETLAMHRRVTGALAPAGRLQVPWPRALGTPPWAMAHQLSATAGPGRPPTPYAVHTVRLDGPAAGRLVQAGLASGRPVALVVGDAWLPRHVVLAVDGSGPSIRCYDPARGRVVTIDVEALVTARLPLGRWTRAWFVVSPTR